MIELQNHIITISEKIYKVCPHFALAALSGSVKNSLPNDSLWEEVETFQKFFQGKYDNAGIKQIPTIKATRKVYKDLGKDPNRYRPSAEALGRRILKGENLYRINTLVDLINLLSLETGYSIGGFDFEHIKGNICLGVGRADEIFYGIGRGALNIEFLPVYRDEKGGIGTPTSDEERTKIQLDTSNLLMLINGYAGIEGLNEAVKRAEELLKKYAYLSDFQFKILTKK